MDYSVLIAMKDGKVISETLLGFSEIMKKRKKKEDRIVWRLLSIPNKWWAIPFRLREKEDRRMKVKEKAVSMK